MQNEKTTAHELAGVSVIDPPCPHAKPGSKEKKRLLAVRAYLRLPLFLAADGRCCSRRRAVATKRPSSCRTPDDDRGAWPVAAGFCPALPRSAFEGRFMSTRMGKMQLSEFRFCLLKPAWLVGVVRFRR